MSDQSGVASLAPEPARVHEPVFIGIAWGGFALATIFTILRSFLRLKVFRRFYLDDAFVFLAWLILLATTISWQILADGMYLDNAVASGQRMPPPDFIPTVERFLKGSAAIVFLFYSTLWSIKLSFLFFFRRLYINMGKLMRIWWGIFAFTIAAWCVCVGTIEYDCLVDPLPEIAQHCSGTSSIHFQRTTLIVNCVMDVVSDAFITCIPFIMLWKVRISPRRKVALGGVFSLTVITIIFSIIRVSVISSLTQQPDMSWLYMWSNIEMFTALTVACLGSFRALFSTKDSVKQTPLKEASTTLEGNANSPRKRSYFRNFTDLFTDSTGHSGVGVSEHDTLQGIYSFYGSNDTRTRRTRRS